MRPRRQDHAYVSLIEPNDFNGRRGVIGVYDAANDYRRIGEFSSHGIGPHEIALLSDNETLVVANGGIATHPDLPRVKLNLPTMTPSLCHIDRRDGRLLHESRLDPALHALSIRHLAVSPADTVALAMQREGPAQNLVPLVAVQHGRGRRPPSRSGRLHLLQGPQAVLHAMKHYCGSVCFDPSGRTIAVSAPRGGCVTFWDVAAGCHLSSARVSDGCGVAPGARPDEFLASSGRGGVFVVDARSGRARPLAVEFLETGFWDNHLALAPGPGGGPGARHLRSPLAADAGAAPENAPDPNYR